METGHQVPRKLREVRENISRTVVEVQFIPDRIKRILSGEKQTRVGDRSTGKERKKGEPHCEDEIFQTDKYTIVADGVGGAGDGEKASSLAVAVIRERLDQISDQASDTDVKNAIYWAVQLAHQQIQRAKLQSGWDTFSGATIAIAYVHKGRLYVVSAGDSRVYVYTKENEMRRKHLVRMGIVAPNGQMDPVIDNIINDPLLCLSIDDGQYLAGLSRAEAFKKQHLFSEADTPGSRNNLMSHLGKNNVDHEVDPNETLDIQVYDFELSPDDIVMVTSDGPTDNLKDSQFSTILAKPDAPADELVTVVMSATRKMMDTWQKGNEGRAKHDDSVVGVMKDFKNIGAGRTEKAQAKEKVKKELSFWDRVGIKNSKGFVEIDWFVTNITDSSVVITKYDNSGLKVAELKLPSENKLVTPNIENRVRKIQNLPDLWQLVNSLAYIKFGEKYLLATDVHRLISNYVNNPSAENFKAIPDTYGIRKKVGELFLRY